MNKNTMHLSQYNPQYRLEHISTASSKVESYFSNNWNSKHTTHPTVTFLLYSRAFALLCQLQWTDLNISISTEWLLSCAQTSQCNFRWKPGRGKCRSTWQAENIMPPWVSFQHPLLSKLQRPSPLAVSRFCEVRQIKLLLSNWKVGSCESI